MHFKEQPEYYKLLNISPSKFNWFNRLIWKYILGCTITIVKDDEPTVHFTQDGEMVKNDGTIESYNVNEKS